MRRLLGVICVLWLTSLATAETTFYPFGETLADDSGGENDRFTYGEWFTDDTDASGDSSRLNLLLRFGP